MEWVKGFFFAYLHQVHVIEGDVVKVGVLDDGGAARVVGRVDEDQHLVGPKHFRVSVKMSDTKCLE